jgi:ABC-type multidrug transport system ATPase subunit
MSLLRTTPNGMYLRLAFAIKTIVRPDILFLDEVMSVGDAAFQLKCKRKIEDLLNDGVSIVFVSHSMNEIIETCSSTLLLDKGVIIEQGHSRSVIDLYTSNIEKPQEEFLYIDEASLDTLFTLRNIKTYHKVKDIRSEKFCYSESVSIYMDLSKSILVAFVMQ